MFTGLIQSKARVQSIVDDGHGGRRLVVIEPDLALWRKPVLDKVPAQFADKWGKGTFESLLAL